MKHFLRMLVILALGAAASILVSCNTMEGAGEDIEDTGEAIQRKADD